MKSVPQLQRYLTYVLVVLFVVPHIALAAGGGLMCSWFSWIISPFGGCQDSIQIVVEPTPPPTPPTSYPTTFPVLTPTIIQYSTTTQPINQTVVEEYVTVTGNQVDEAMLVRLLRDALEGQFENRPLTTPAAPTPTSLPTDLVTRDYLLKSLDRVYDAVGDSNSSNSNSDSVDVSADIATALLTSPSLFGADFTGTTTMADGLALGTTTLLDLLTIDGAIYLAETSPLTTTNRLYNFDGDLYWNGSVVTSSTTANWSQSGGDVFRLSGNVSIGTTTTSGRLTVDGTARFTGTTTAPLVDAGGQMCNVTAYGAIGDNSTINDTAIAAAIADCPEGGIVYFPMGQFRISVPIVLDRPVTLRGAYSPRWSYSSTPRSSIRAAFGAFTGVALVHVRDRTISGEVDHNNGGRLEHLSLDGGSTGADVDGIYFEGLVRDWKLTDVDISQVTGNGFEAAVGTGSGNPRGFTIRGLSIYSADGHGFRATALNDSYIEDLLAVGNALRGIYLSSMGETKVNNSRAVFNALEGLYIDGASNNGGLMFTDFSTDRNDRHGVRISLTGTTTVTFNGLLTRRDGANLGGGIETPYAGVAVIGAPGEKVAPVFINGLSQIVGLDDSANPPLAPLVGVRVVNSSYVKVDGQLWGVDDAYLDGGGNNYFLIADNSIIKTGNVGVTETAPPLYHSGWVRATTTARVAFDGQVNIGSSTSNRLLNIVAPNNAGARFLDTTNNVTFDMRAEDFQAFFGTFSNHQLRFQTNNTSRLTIDTSGRVGIGTTNPASLLSVAGDTLLSGALRATSTVRFDTLTSGLLLANSTGVLSSIGTSSLNIALVNTTGSLPVNRGGTGLTSFGGTNTVLFTTTANTLASNANFTFTGTNLALAGTTGLLFGGDALLSRGAADQLDLATGDSLNLVSGSLLAAGTTVVDSSRRLFTANGAVGAGTLAYSFSADTNTGLYGTGSDVLGFVTGGSERMRVDGSGNVGIGTTTPRSTLDVWGSLRVGTGTLPSLVVENSRVEITSDILLNGGFLSTSNLIYLRDNTPGAVDASLGFFAAGRGSASANQGAYFLARGNDFTDQLNQRGNILFVAGNPSTPSDNEGSLEFWTGNEQRRLIINNSGNVGIGTTSPSSKLDVYSDTDQDAFRVRTNSGYSWKITSTGSFESGLGVGFAFDTNLVSIPFSLGSYSDLYIGSGISGGTGDIIMSPNNGNVGIGTTSPSAQLTVDDTVRFASITGGSLETDALGNVTVSSDERLKDILSVYEAGLNEILGLEPIRYRWNEVSGYDQASVYAGFSAQNVEDLIPDAVGEDGRGYKTLSTRPILAAVVNAIQELFAMVTGNTKRIAELEARIEALESTQGNEYVPPVTNINDSDTEIEESEPPKEEVDITGESTATSTLSDEGIDNDSTPATREATEIGAGEVLGEDQIPTVEDDSLDTLPVDIDEESVPNPNQEVQENTSQDN